MPKTIGVPAASKTSILDKYTVRGSGGAAARWAYNDALNQSNAINSVATGLDTRVFPTQGNPYINQIRTRVYDGDGMGDGEESTWADIAKVFTGEVSKGIGGKIGGYSPYVTSTTLVQGGEGLTSSSRSLAAKDSESSLPGWVLPAAIGCGGLAIFLLTRRSR